jgi:hypothetical protein
VLLSGEKKDSQDHSCSVEQFNNSHVLSGEHIGQDHPCSVEKFNNSHMFYLESILARITRV